MFVFVIIGAVAAAAAVYFLVIRKSDGGSAASPPAAIQPDWVLTGTHGGRSVAVAMSPYRGAAIYSLKWGGVELLDHSDDGRELQTAWQLDDMIEEQNPTEAGSTGEGTSDNPYQCSTKILSATKTGDTVFTSSVNPAYWHAYQGQLTSPHVLNKTITLGYGGMDNVIRHDLLIKLVNDHSHIVTEGITSYHPRNFNTFFTLDGDTLTQVPTPSANVGTSLPVIAATADKQYAVGLWHPNPALGYGYSMPGGWPKLDAAWWEKKPAPAGDYPYVVFSIFGTVDDVVASIKQLRSTVKV